MGGVQTPYLKSKKNLTLTRVVFESVQMQLLSQKLTRFNFNKCCTKNKSCNNDVHPKYWTY